MLEEDAKETATPRGTDNERSGWSSCLTVSPRIPAMSNGGAVHIQKDQRTERQDCQTSCCRQDYPASPVQEFVHWIVVVICAHFPRTPMLVTASNSSPPEVRSPIHSRA